MRTYEELKQLLTHIKESDYAIPSEICLDALITDMINFIGDTDAELRDELIYSTFCEWADNGCISTTQMKHVLTLCLDNDHLFYGIGENDTDSVFTRSFSSLQVALAFCLHDQSLFLTGEEILNIKDIVLCYVAKEKDFRGYVNGKGWAHAVAHIADALANISGADKAADGEFSLGREVLLQLLGAVKSLICNKDWVYIAEEDERLVSVVIGVCGNEVLSTKELINWLESFNMADKEWWNGTIPGDFNLHVNRKNFMRSLYFEFLSCKDDDFDTICLKEICEYMRGFPCTHTKILAIHT